MNDQQEEEIKKKIRYMTNQIWEGISVSDKDEFLSNFGEEQEVGLTLLDMLIYYSCTQEECIVKNLIRMLNRELWIQQIGVRKSSKAIQKDLNKIYENMCFVPVNDQDPSDSALSLTSMYKKSGLLPKKIRYTDVQEIPLMLAIKKKYFVFYDDVIGTGQQFENFWNDDRRFNDKEKVSLNFLFDLNTDVHCYYLVFSGFQDSIERLKGEFPNLNILVSEIFTKDYSIYDDSNEYWDLNNDTREAVQTYVKVKQEQLKPNIKHSLNLPLLFQHGRSPNTSLFLYWYDKENVWHPLCRR